jgi:hypothetical protein
MPTTLRFFFLLIVGLLGLQPVAYTYDAIGFVSSAGAIKKGHAVPFTLTRIGSLPNEGLWRASCDWNFPGRFTM